MGAVSILVLRPPRRAVQASRSDTCVDGPAWQEAATDTSLEGSYTRFGTCFFLHNAYLDTQQTSLFRSRVDKSTSHHSLVYS